MALKITDFLTMSDNKTFSTMKRAMGKGVVTDSENYLYKHNENSRYLIVAHLDTVCDAGFKHIVTDIEKQCISNVNGILGADDRAGCFMVYQLLKNTKLPDFDVLITNYEECGGLGVGRFIKDKVINLENIRLFIELDRMGANEYVSYTPLPDQVKTYIEKFGFKENRGSYSDIADLSEEYLVPSLNLSVGYYHQHTKKEYLNLKEMKEISRKMNFIISNPIDQLYPIEIDDFYNTNVFYESEEPIVCPTCGADAYELDGYCYECGSHLDWCNDECFHKDQCANGHFRVDFYDDDCQDCKYFTSNMLNTDRAVYQ